MGQPRSQVTGGWDNIPVVSAQKMTGCFVTPGHECN